jgi:hypothetical protein
MSDRQAGESPPRSRWKSWRARPLVSRMPGSRTRHRAIRCRKNCGIPCWPIRAPPAGHRCRSSNAASLKFRDTYCASNARAAFASSKFRRPMRSDFMARMPSGRMSGSDCSTRPAAIGQAGTRKMDAGPAGWPDALVSYWVAIFREALADCSIFYHVPSIRWRRLGDDGALWHDGFPKNRVQRGSQC